MWRFPPVGQPVTIFILSDFVRLRMFFSGQKNSPELVNFKLAEPKMGSSVDKFFLKNKYVYK